MNGSKIKNCAILKLIINHINYLARLLINYFVSYYILNTFERFSMSKCAQGHSVSIITNSGTALHAQCPEQKSGSPIHIVLSIISL